MTELPQATSRRELREREQALAAAQARSSGSRRGGASRARRPEKARPVRNGKPVRPQSSRAHRVGSKLLSLGAMIFAGALAFGMSVPANAFYPTASSSGAALADAATTGGQAAAVPSDETVDVASRDTINVLSWAQVLAQKYAHGGATVGGTSGGSIRWPFPYATKISSPYGPRVAPCSGCSTFHNGVDFTPGANSAIFAVASGVVTGREDGTSEYGNYIIVTSQLSGQTVKFTYAHMTAGSSAIVLGQRVEVGDFLGLVGMTGEATGPHLHFEVNVNGTTIDPIPWLETNVD
ncbi:MAG TPA: M23 family metallopeptidase [Pseudolysinimonas sp.]|jgi:murein DD-endopeptidase MepM/ murein hydrolase activator NlpD